MKSRAVDHRVTALVHHDFSFRFLRLNLLSEPKPCSVLSDTSNYVRVESLLDTLDLGLNGKEQSRPAYIHYLFNGKSESELVVSMDQELEILGGRLMGGMLNGKMGMQDNESLETTNLQPLAEN